MVVLQHRTGAPYNRVVQQPEDPLRTSPVANVARCCLLACTACSGGSSDAGSNSGNTGNPTSPSTPTLASITVTPNPVTVAAGATQQFAAAGRDAGGNTFAFTPSWSVAAGGGTISSTGVFTAGATAGTFNNTVRATGGAITGAATVTVSAPAVIDVSAIASGKILVTASGSTDPDQAYRMWVMNADGTGRTAVTSQSGNLTAPDVEKAGAGWLVAWGRENQVHVFNSTTGVEVTFVSTAISDRPDLEGNGNRVVYQGGPNGEAGLNVLIASASAVSVPTALTTLAPGGGGSNNAEWPYFVPGSNQILYQLSSATPPRHVMNTDGTGDAAIAAPGGFSISHLGVKADGSEFLHAQRLTSYSIATGAVGTISSLKTTTTMLAQLGALGFAEVPIATVPGQGNAGTFALSVDWSRDGTKLVFDALVATAGTGVIRGIAIFTWNLQTNTLALVYGPEPLTASRTNNYNYSLGTPKWVP